MALDSRFQTTCWRRIESPLTIAAIGERTLSIVISLASAEARTDSSAASTTTRSSTRSGVDAHLAGHDETHVQQVGDQLRLHPGIAVDDGEALGERLWSGCFATRGPASSQRWR